MLCGGEGGVAMYHLQQRGASFSRILGIKASMWQPNIQQPSLAAMAVQRKVKRSRDDYHAPVLLP